MGGPDPAGGEDVGVAMPERIERVYDRRLLVADHPHFHEIDAERGEIFRDIANVLILGAAGQDLVADHQERSSNDFFGRGRIYGCHVTSRTQQTADDLRASQRFQHQSFSVSSYYSLHSIRAMAGLPGRRTQRVQAPSPAAVLRIVGYWRGSVSGHKTYRARRPASDQGGAEHL